MPFKQLTRSITSQLLSFQRSESKFVWILIAVFSLIIFNPFIPAEGIGVYFFNLLLSFIVLSGILAASDERQIIKQLAFIGLFLIILDWIRSLASQEIPGMSLLIYALYGIFILTVTISIIIGVVRSPKVTANIICGAVAAYLLIGLSGGFIALCIETFKPGAFLSGGEVLPRQGLFGALLYYSMVSLSTIGYGDITPKLPIARSISLAIGLIGQIYLTVLVAMLVGKFLKD
jgi:voltage-gated potassium channel